MKQIFMCKPGAFSAKDKERITKAGYCVVETNDFEACRLIDPSVPVERDAIFRAAMFAISTADGNQGPKGLFGRRMAELLSQPPK